MFKYHLILVLISSIAAFPGISIANDYTWTDNGYVMNWTSGNLEISSSQWNNISILKTYNDVTVTMTGGGGTQFYIYDNSELFMYGSDPSITYLYLYENATASFFGYSYMNELYIDPANTGSVKLYATLDRFEPLSPYGEGHLYGNWLSDGDPFNIHLVGQGAYSHIQFIPEPTTIAFLALGGLASLKRRKR